MYIGKPLETLVLVIWEIYTGRYHFFKKIEGILLGKDIFQKFFYQVNVYNLNRNYDATVRFIGIWKFIFIFW
jgi:hypothetical protein